jgi:hypothetical protein
MLCEDDKHCRVIATIPNTVERLWRLFGYKQMKLDELTESG